MFPSMRSAEIALSVAWNLYRIWKGTIWSCKEKDDKELDWNEEASSSSSLSSPVDRLNGFLMLSSKLFDCCRRVSRKPLVQLWSLSCIHCPIERCVNFHLSSQLRLRCHLQFRQRCTCYLYRTTDAGSFGYSKTADKQNLSYPVLPSSIAAENLPKFSLDDLKLLRKEL